jgi:hypothetical protein
MDEGMEKGGGGGIELPWGLAGVVMPAMRQGLVIINDSREAEAVVQFFTAMIVDKNPREITSWCSEYMAVGNVGCRSIVAYNTCAHGIRASAHIYWLA